MEGGDIDESHEESAHRGEERERAMGSHGSRKVLFCFVLF